MAKWWIHLGYQPNSAYIGQVWDNVFDKTTKSSKYRFLQYAVAKTSSGDEPTWFNFNAEDALYFYIWNLGESSSWSAKALYMCCSETNSSATIDAPSTYLSTVTNKHDDKDPIWDFSNPDYFGTTGFEKHYMDSACPWNTAYTSYQMTIGGVKFTKAVTCNLSFYLVAADNGSDTRYFISDPEVIVGSKGT